MNDGCTTLNIIQFIEKNVYIAFLSLFIQVFILWLIQIWQLILFPFFCIGSQEAPCQPWELLTVTGEE